MTEIGGEEMIEALARWHDFESVRPVDLERLAEWRRRLNEGEELRDIIAEQIKEQGQAALDARDALRAVAEGVGLTPEGKMAFALGITLLVKGYEPLPIETALDTAAYVGLIVGLTARQLADERQADT